MPQRLVCLIFATFLALPAGPIERVIAQSAEERIDFDRQIRPILSDRCYFCHGPDAESRAADLRLDLADEARSVIEAGDAGHSELFRRISTDDPSERMPPADSKLTVTQDERELIRRWIDEGANWKQHWAFEPPRQTEWPVVKDESWPRGAIDRYVLATLERQGLQPSLSAPRHRLLRRLTFDLTGLPPTIEELDAFLSDRGVDAYERVVDRLLASPRFGERMASVWLDAARYSDTYGYQVDRDRHVWPWRDWVIQSINGNMPYDQFLIEQLAGDLLPSASDDQRLATTFNRLHPQKVEGGSVEEEFRVEYVADRTQTMATAVMGLTLECARCHDHKYDPISQAEYYQLFSYFNNIDEAGLYSYFTNSVPSPSMLLMGEDEKRQLAELRGAVATAETNLDSIRPTRRAEFQLWLDKQEEWPVPEPDSKLDFETVNAGGNQRIADGEDAFAIRFTGDDEVKTDFGNYRRYQPFSIAARIKVPEHKQRAVVLHRSRAWTDAGSRGYQWLIENGKLSAALIHFWPGNAIGIESVDEIPTNQWLNVVMTYDGSSRAAGINLYVDGRRVQARVVRDNLVKKITGGGGDHLTLGARFRDNGFAGGLISRLAAYERELTSAEIRLMNGLQTSDSEESYERYLYRVDAEFGNRLNALEQSRKRLAEFLDQRREIMVMEEQDEPRPSYVLVRGLYDQRGTQVGAGTPAALSVAEEPQPRDRLELARWLTRPEHPLTSRVAINRLWQMLFGEGLVGTPEDFGRQGARPTHPELLDWMAVDFVQHGWDVKRMVKQIVMSSTYRQSSEVTREQMERDPGNEWLSRGPSYRLPAEMVRDNALAVSGLLVEKIGGPPAKPYEVAVSFKPATPDQGPGLYRRSLYTYWRRTAPAPVMMALDASKRDVCRVKRERTSSPLQSLVLMNSPQFVEASRKMAEEFVRQEGTGAESATLVSQLFRRLTSRKPAPEEIQVIQSLLQQQYQLFAAEPASALEFLDVGHTKSDVDTIDATRLAAWTSVVCTLMSHDECVTKR